MIWCILWFFCVRNCPDHHQKITDNEREYIKSNLKSQNLQARKEAAKNVPWRALLLSMPVIACCICSFVNGMYVSLTSSYIPTYFREVLKLNLKSVSDPCPNLDSSPFTANILYRMDSMVPCHTSLNGSSNSLSPFYQTK